MNENKITEIKNVESLTNLTTFDLSDNLISKLQGLDNQVNLQELWLTKNTVEHFSELEYLQKLPSLQTIYLERCPIFFYPDYKVKIIEICPRIKQIDAFIVQ